MGRLPIIIILLSQSQYSSDWVCCSLKYPIFAQFIRPITATAYRSEQIGHHFICVMFEQFRLPPANLVSILTNYTIFTYYILSKGTEQKLNCVEPSVSFRSKEWLSVIFIMVHSNIFYFLNRLHPIIYVQVLGWRVIRGNSSRQCLWRPLLHHQGVKLHTDTMQRFMTHGQLFIFQATVTGCSIYDS